VRLAWLLPEGSREKYAAIYCGLLALHHHGKVQHMTLRTIAKQQCPTATTADEDEQKQRMLLLSKTTSR
jgi:hypothetical protein